MRSCAAAVLLVYTNPLSVRKSALDLLTVTIIITGRGILLEYEGTAVADGRRYGHQDLLAQMWAVVGLLALAVRLPKTGELSLQNLIWYLRVEDAETTFLVDHSHDWFHQGVAPARGVHWDALIALDEKPRIHGAALLWHTLGARDGGRKGA